MTPTSGAISARGYNGRFASRLLVLFDGRTVYTPLFSGVFWDRQDVLLEDIDRIEIIRGPGATLWGANAVNGVINIITKRSENTLGSLVTAGAGTEERAFVGARHGLRLGSDTSLRVYAKYFDRDSMADATGKEAADNWHSIRGGFRLDSYPNAYDHLTLQSDIYDGRLGETYNVPFLTAPFRRTLDQEGKNFGGNLLSRWEHELSASSSLALQFYYDRDDQDFALLGETRDTIDLDFQHRFKLGKRQDLLWGVGYRFINDKIRNTNDISFAPDRRSDNLFSAFLQDDITIIAERLRLTLGCKFEHNDSTGFEWQPNVRLLWTPHKRHTVWAAVSRAVRTPSHTENDIRLNSLVLPPATPLNPGSLPLLVLVKGSRNLQAEELTAYELGYRLKPFDAVSFDLAVYYNVYHNLIVTGSPGTPFFETSPVTHITVPIEIVNEGSAHTWGAELVADWEPLNWWRFHAAYTFLEIRENPTGPSVAPLLPAGLNPSHQFSLRSQMDLGTKVGFDLWLRYVDRLPIINVGSYVTLDARLSWRPVKNLEIALVGQNLVENHHPEFKSGLINTLATEVERSIYGSIKWNF